MRRHTLLVVTAIVVCFATACTAGIPFEHVAITPMPTVDAQKRDLQNVTQIGGARQALYSLDSATKVATASKKLCATLSSALPKDAEDKGHLPNEKNTEIFLTLINHDKMELSEIESVFGTPQETDDKLLLSLFFSACDVIAYSISHGETDIDVADYILKDSAAELVRECSAYASRISKDPKVNYKVLLAASNVMFEIDSTPRHMRENEFVTYFVITVIKNLYDAAQAAITPEMQHLFGYIFGGTDEFSTMETVSGKLQAKISAMRSAPIVQPQPTLTPTIRFFVKDSKSVLAAATALEFSIDDANISSRDLMNVMYTANVGTLGLSETKNMLDGITSDEIIKSFDELLMMVKKRLVIYGDYFKVSSIIQDSEISGYLDDLREAMIDFSNGSITAAELESEIIRFVNRCDEPLSRALALKQLGFVFEYFAFCDKSSLNEYALRKLLAQNNSKFSQSYEETLEEIRIIKGA